MANGNTDKTQFAAPTSGQDHPLFVDLDDTLVLGDTLWESFAILLRQNLLAAVVALCTLFRGRAAFKSKVAKYVQFSPAHLKYNDEVVAFVRGEAAAGRTTILATAADSRVAAAVAEHLGCFKHVMASDGNQNLKGANKSKVIAAYAEKINNEKSFDYVGDSKADRPIWQAAGRAMVVAADELAARKVVGPAVPIVRVLPKPAQTFGNLIKAMRLHQWVKNVLIFVPLFLSHQFTDGDKIISALAAFVCFGLCASATYIWNDILDLYADRSHPRKQHRPFAAGLISIPRGLSFSFLLLVASFSLAGLLLPVLLPLLLVGYIVITLTYSLYLKQKLLLDAMTLGLLYAYRLMVGAVATGVVISDWLIAFSCFFFLGLALVKRYSEIETKALTITGKIPGRGYYTGDREVIGVIGITASFMSVLILALYITSPAVVTLYRFPEALWLVCFIMIYWLARIWVLAHRGHMPDDPISFALRDKVSLLAGAACGLAVLLASL